MASPILSFTLEHGSCGERTKRVARVREEERYEGNEAVEFNAHHALQLEDDVTPGLRVEVASDKRRASCVWV